MSLSFRSSFLTVLVLGLTASWLGATPPSSVSDKAWDSAATFRSNEAFAEFTKVQAKKSGDPREISLGRATALLGVQPKTAQNIEEAASLCQQLIQENPNDRPGLLATYLLARIEQFHRQPTNPKKAAEIYSQLLQQHPESLIAQVSASKLAVLVLFDPEATPAQQKKALGDFETMLPKLTIPQARRDTLIVMGNACINFKLNDEKALGYLIEAEAAQISSVKLRGDTLIQIGMVAQKLGRKDVALKYYNLFVDQYKRDVRNYLVRQKVAELKSAS